MSDVYKIPRRKRKIPSINMSPLVDLTFLLLIFFMLSTTLVLQTGIDVKKPKAVSSQLLPRTSIIITVTKDHKIYIGKNLFTWEDFKTNLAKEIQKHRDSNIVVVTDMDTRMKPVVDVLDEAKKLGANRISLATEYEKWE